MENFADGMRSCPVSLYIPLDGLKSLRAYFLDDLNIFCLSMFCIKCVSKKSLDYGVFCYFSVPRIKKKIVFNVN